MFNDLLRPVSEVVASDPGFLITADTYVAFGSVIIALSAVGLALFEGYQSRKYNRLSVSPKLHNHSREIKPNVFQWFLVNGGLGPAHVSKLEFRYLSEGGLHAIENIKDYAIDIMGGRVTDRVRILTKRGATMPILPGAKQAVLEITFPEGGVSEETHKIIDDLSFTTKFKDMYGKKR